MLHLSTYAGNYVHHVGQRLHDGCGLNVLVTQQMVFQDIEQRDSVVILEGVACSSKQSNCETGKTTQYTKPPCFEVNDRLIRRYLLNIPFKFNGQN